MKRNLLLFNIVFLFSAMIIAQPIEELDSRIHKDFYNRDLNIDFLNTNTCTDSLTFSSESIFNHAHTLFTSVTSLTENKFVVVYSDHGNSKYGTAVIGTITDDSISYGSCYIFNSWPTARLWVTSLDTNSFVISYGDSLNFFNDHESVIAGSVVGNEISFGNQVVFSTSYGYYDNPVTRLNLNTFVVVYRDNNNSDYGTAVIGSVSGNTISMGTGYVYSSSINTGGEFAGRNSLTYLDSTKFVVTYTNYNNNYNGVAIVGTVLGNAITFGAEYVFSIGRSLQLSATCLDPEHFVVSYTDVENGDYGTSIVGTVSGNIITFGSEYEFFSEWTSYISSSRLQANRFVVVYWNWENNIHNGTSRVGYVDGNTICFDNPVVFNPAYSFYESVASLNADRFVVVYGDEFNGTPPHRGTAIVGTISQYPVKTIINSDTTCPGIVEIPVITQSMEDVIEFSLTLDYDTIFQSYTGYQSSNPQLDSGTLSVSESNGQINIYWNSSFPANIDYDTLIELLFYDSLIFSQFSHDFVWDTNSYYKDTQGSYLVTSFYDGQLISNPIPIEADTIIGATVVCQGSDSELYQIESITHATSYVWVLFPDSAGSITSADTIITIDFSPSYIGQAILSVYGSNNCGYGASSLITIDIVSLPEQPITPEGPIVINLNVTQSSEYTTSNIANATNYEWFLFP